MYCPRARGPELPPAVRPPLHLHGHARWLSTSELDYRGGWTVGEWKQGKCGWPTAAGGRCQNKTVKGTSRCHLRQGDWTKRGQAELKKRASRRRKK